MSDTPWTDAHELLRSGFQKSTTLTAAEVRDLERSHNRLTGTLKILQRYFETVVENGSKEPADELMLFSIKKALKQAITP